MMGAQALLPALVAVGCLYATIFAFRSGFDPLSSGITVVAVVCLVLVQPPREVTAQLTSPRLSAVLAVIYRWLLILAAILGIAYVTKAHLQDYPRRVFLTWAAVTPCVLILSTLAMQEFMRRFLMQAINARSAVIAGYNTSSVELARRLKRNPGMRLEVKGFFDDRSIDRLGIGAGDASLVGPLTDLGPYVKEHRTDVIFIALPIRHLRRVMNLLDDLRDTTCSIYYVPDIFVFDLIQARSGEIQGIPVVAMCETPFYGYRGVAKRLTDVVLSTVILLLLMPLLALTRSRSTSFAP
jgi:putative colanic acid biosynthesis UDP-glucose lipid carrier transferase